MGLKTTVIYVKGLIWCFGNRQYSVKLDIFFRTFQKGIGTRMVIGMLLAMMGGDFLHQFQKRDHYWDPMI